MREVDSRWNHFVPSLYLLHTKLTDFGVALVDNEVVYEADT